MTPIDPEDQEYYDDYFELFASKGWNRFVEDLEAALEVDRKTAAARCDTSDKWFMERGSQGRTLRILNMQASMETTYQSITEDEVDDSFETDED